MFNSETRLLHIGHSPELEQLLGGLADVRTPARYIVTTARAMSDVTGVDCDLILFDLPDGDSPFAGIDALVASLPTLPIIAVAAHGSEALAAEALCHGAADFLALDDPLTASLIDRAARCAIERVQMHQALRDSEARYQLITENAADMVARLAIDGVFTYVSPASTALLGYRPDELIGRNMRDLLHPDDLPTARDAYRLAMTSSGRTTVTYRIRCQDGRYIWFETTARGIRNPATGEVDEIITTSRDVTERNQAEKEIRESERFARSTLDALSEHIAILDRRGTIVALNRAWVHCEPHMCWTAGIGEGTPYLDFCELATGRDGKQGRAIAAGIRGVMNGATDHFSYEYSCERADGQETWYSVAVTPYPDDARYSVVVAHLDVTARKRAENAQRTTEERFRHAADNLPDAFIIYDADRRIRFINQIALRLFGMTEDQVLGKRSEDLVPADMTREFLPHLERAYTTGQPQRHETTDPTPDGIKTYVVTYVPQLDEHDHVYEMLSLTHDVSEHKRAELAEQEQRTLAEALRDTSAALNSTLDLRTVMVRILDNVGRVVAHDAANIMLVEGDSARAAYWQGYDQEHDDYFTRERFSFEWPKIAAMLSGSPMLVPEIDKDPDWYPLPLATNPRSTIGVPIHSHNRVIGFLNLESQTSGFFSATDVDRLRAFANYAAIAIENAQLYETMRYYAAELEQRVEERTQELQRAKEQVEAILNSRSDAVILTFLTGVIRQVNPAFAELFGYDVADVTGASIEMLADDTQPDMLFALNDVIATNQPRRLECLMRRKDGTTFNADAMLSPVQNGNLLGIVCSVRDISARKQMEYELRRAYEAERELGELKSRFVSMASHEFRSPLSTILASSDLLRHYSQKMSDERRGEHFDNIENTIRHLVRLIDDVLMLGRADANRLEIHPAPVELVQFFREISLELTPAGGANGSPIYFSSPLPAIEAAVDRKLLRQVITNLLSNAVKYSPAGTPVYFTVARESDEVVMTVTDSGIGIPLKDQEHLFEAFHRGANVDEIEGSGLGLAIIQRAVNLHGGSIHFESEVGVGTTFIVRIPVAPARPEVRQPEIEVDLGV